MQPLHILLLGPDGSGRSALESTLTRLGCVVMSADPAHGQVPAGAGDVIVADLRHDDAGWGVLAEALRGDPRPLVMVADRPRRIVRLLSGRRAGTLVMTGAESDAGYRVALSVCAGLRDSSLERAQAGGGLTGWGTMAVRAAAR